MVEQFARETMEEKQADYETVSEMVEVLTHTSNVHRSLQSSTRLLSHSTPKQKTKKRKIDNSVPSSLNDDDDPLEPITSYESGEVKSPKSCASLQQSKVSYIPISYNGILLLRTDFCENFFCKINFWAEHFRTA